MEGEERRRENNVTKGILTRGKGKDKKEMEQEKIEVKELKRKKGKTEG